MGAVKLHAMDWQVKAWPTLWLTCEAGRSVQQDPAHCRHNNKQSFVTTPCSCSSQRNRSMAGQQQLSSLLLCVHVVLFVSLPLCPRRVNANRDLAIS